MDQLDIDALQEALSLERFGRYLEWAAGDKERAVALYTLNCQLSESLYTSLHMLEVALRNEPPRVCRRLQLLRRWSHHGQYEQQVLA